MVLTRFTGEVEVLDAVAWASRVSAVCDGEPAGAVATTTLGLGPLLKVCCVTVSEPTRGCLYDVAGFSVKWLCDLAVDQWDNGCLTNFAPDPGGRAVQHLPTEIVDQFAGSSRWGDASVIVPWELYLAYYGERVTPVYGRWSQSTRSGGASSATRRW